MMNNKPYTINVFSTKSVALMHSVVSGFAFSFHLVLLVVICLSSPLEWLML